MILTDLLGINTTSLWLQNLTKMKLMLVSGNSPFSLKKPLKSIHFLKNHPSKESAEKSSAVYVKGGQKNQHTDLNLVSGFLKDE